MNIEIKDDKKQAKYWSKNYKCGEEQIIYRYKLINEKARCNSTEYIGKYQLTDISNRHGYNPHNPPFRRKEENASSIFS